MNKVETYSAKLTRAANQIAARLSTMARPATGFVSQPEPKTLGTFARGRQLLAGNYMFAGYLVEAKGVALWDLPMPHRYFEEELHGFTWLDDLASVGDKAARDLSQNWTNRWIENFGGGRGPGWTPDLTGRRLIRLINNALFLLNGQERHQSDAYFSSLGQQTIFLARRWKSAPAGLPRFEALTGLIYAGLALTGMDRFVDPAVRALSRECVEQIDQEGGIPTRNPEELLEVFTLLNWAATALGESGRVASAEHMAAIERIAPTLRALRHSDGGLARFHGGGRGMEGRLDQALASSGARAVANTGLSMGFARLSAGRTSVIVDAAAPPSEKASYNAHASTLALELTSGRRPLIVNCGSGTSFGEEWRRAGRATPSHSTLGIAGYSSSRLGRAGFVAGQRQELLTDPPKEVTVQQGSGLESVSFAGTHTGYQPTHGLSHLRRLELTHDGRDLIGQDSLHCVNDADQRRLTKAMERAEHDGIDYAIRFHLHPEVNAELDMGGNAVSLALRSGEIWVFRHDTTVTMTLEPSVYLEKYRLKPRAAKQIVLRGKVIGAKTQVSWTLAKAQETPNSIRDVEMETSHPNT